MYEIKIKSFENSISVKHATNTIDIKTAGRGPAGPTGPQGPQGIPGDPASNIVTSVNTQIGDVVLDADDVGADVAGSAAQALIDANDYTDVQVGLIDTEVDGKVDKNTLMFNVKDYGALGNNSNDDTSSIQAAINAASTAGGGIVFLPAGIYKITAQIVLKNSVSLIGAGCDQTTSLGTIIRQYTTTANGLYMPATTSTSGNLRIADIRIEASGTNTSGRGVYFDIDDTGGAVPIFRNIAMKNVFIARFGQWGMEAQGVIVSTFENVVCYRNGNGFYFNGDPLGTGYSRIITSITLTSCYADTNTGYGFKFDYVVYSVLSSCASDQNNIQYSFFLSDAITLQSCGSEWLSGSNPVDGIAYQLIASSRMAINQSSSYNAKTAIYLGKVAPDTTGFVTVNGFNDLPSGGSDFTLVIEENCQVLLINTPTPSGVSGSGTVGRIDSSTANLNYFISPKLGDYRAYNTVDQTVNYERARMYFESDVYYLVSEAGGTGTRRDVQVGFSTALGTRYSQGTTKILEAIGSTTAAGKLTNKTGTLAGSSGEQILNSLTPTISQTGSASYVGHLVDITENSTGSGTKYIQDLRVGGTSKYRVANDGLVTASNRITSVTDPTSAQDAATKNYVDNAIAGVPLTNYVLKAGDTMTGTLNGRSIIPTTTATYSLGSSSSYYSNAYLRQINLSSTIQLDGFTDVNYLAVTGGGLFQSAASGTILRFASANSFSSGLRVQKRGLTGDVNGAVASGAEVGYHQFEAWTGTTYKRLAYVIVRSSAAITDSTGGSRYDISTRDDNNTENIKISIDINGLYPGINNTFSLGTTTRNWTNVFSQIVTIPSGGTGFMMYNTADQVTNTERVLGAWSSNIWTLSSQSTGTGTQRAMRFMVGASQINLSNAGTEVRRDTTAVSELMRITSTGLTASNSAQRPLLIDPTYVQTGTASATDILVNRTETSVGSGQQNLIDLQVAGSSKFRVSNAGIITLTEAANIVLGTTTGTKIGTSTNQKLSLWNKTPIVQPTTAITGATRVGGGGTAVTDTDTFGGYTIAKIAQALIDLGVLA